jgi:hypothetical protein
MALLRSYPASRRSFEGRPRRADFRDKDIHRERQVEVLRQLGPTTYPERPSVK